MANDPRSNWKVLLVMDDCRDAAIDENVTAEAFVAYARSRTPETAKAILSEGSSPTWWTLAPLSLGFVTATMGADNPTAIAVRACRAALVAVDGPMGEGVSFENRAIGEGGMTLLPQSAMDVLMQKIGLAGIVELGDIAIVRSRLAAGKHGPFGLAAQKIGT